MLETVHSGAVARDFAALWRHGSSAQTACAEVRQASCLHACPDRMMASPGSPSAPPTSLESFKINRYGERVRCWCASVSIRNVAASSTTPAVLGISACHHLEQAPILPSPAHRVGRHRAGRPVLMLIGRITAHAALCSVCEGFRRPSPAYSVDASHVAHLYIPRSSCLLPRSSDSHADT